MENMTIEITADENLLIAQMAANHMQYLATQPQSAERDQDMRVPAKLVGKLLPGTSQRARLEERISLDGLN